jgi:hypothetical protein
MAVGLRALPGKKDIVRLDAPRIVAERADDAVDRAPDGPGLDFPENFGKFHSAAGVELELKTGVAGAGAGKSVGMFMICAACRAMAAKTGAETSAP